LKKLVPFFVLYFIAILVGLVAMIITEKGGVIIFLNGYHNTWLDKIFIFLSVVVEVPAFIALAILLLFKNYRASIQIGAAGLLTLVCSLGLKSFFAHPRPLQYFESLDKLDLLQLIPGSHPIEGLTSFPSGHTTAAFAMMLSMSMIFNRRWVSVVCVLLAIGTALSRIYLVNHFVEDVLAGSFLGVSLAFFVFMILEKLKVPSWKSILELRNRQVNPRP